MIPTLSTERLVLRPLAAVDGPTYVRFYADPEGSRFYGGPLRPDQAWKRLAQDIGHWHLRGYGLWAMDRRDNGAKLGGCGLLWADGWPRPELTWWLLAEARGQGVATEASDAAIDWALDVAGWTHVETHMNDENEAARRLAIRLGGIPIARERFPDGLDRTVYRLSRRADRR